MTSDSSWRLIARTDSSRVVGADLVEGAEHVVLIVEAHRREEGKRHEPLLGGFSDRAQPGTVLELLAIERMPVDERVMERRADVLGAKGLQDRVPVDGQALETQEDHEEMPAVPSVRRQRRQLDERRALEPLPIALGDPIASLPEALEPVELAPPERGLEVGQAVGVDETDHGVAPRPGEDGPQDA